MESVFDDPGYYGSVRLYGESTNYLGVINLYTSADDGTNRTTMKSAAVKSNSSCDYQTQNCSSRTTEFKENSDRNVSEKTVCVITFAGTFLDEDIENKNTISCTGYEDINLDEYYDDIVCLRSAVTNVKYIKPQLETYTLNYDNDGEGIRYNLNCPSKFHFYKKQLNYIRTLLINNLSQTCTF